MRWGILILSFMVLAGCSRIGDRLPEFEMRSMDGELWDHNKLAGNVVHINVWATWCGQCVSEIASLNALKERYGDQMVFIALSDEGAAQIASFQKRYPFKYTQFAEAGALISKLKTRLVKTYPQNLLVDRNGIIVFEETEGEGDIYHRLNSQIKELL